MNDDVIQNWSDKDISDITKRALEQKRKEDERLIKQESEKLPF